MAIRRNTDFPIYQWTALGFVFARTPEEAWVLKEQFKFTGSTSELEARMVEGKQAVNRILHGAACDITWAEYHKLTTELCQRHNKQLSKLIPGLPKEEES